MNIQNTFRIIMIIAVMAFLTAIMTACQMTVYQQKPAVENVVIPKSESTVKDVFEIHDAVFANYTYKLDPEGSDVWTIFDTTKPFEGDCEDFAFSLQRAVGAGSVYVVYLYQDDEVDYTVEKPNHAVFIYMGIVWELDGTTHKASDYEIKYGKIFYSFGDIAPDWK